MYNSFRVDWSTLGVKSEFQWALRTENVFLCSTQGWQLYLHDGLPVSMSKEVDARQLSDGNTSGSFEWWRIGEVVTDGTRGWWVGRYPQDRHGPRTDRHRLGDHFDTSIRNSSVVFEPENYLMLFYEVWWVGTRIDMLEILSNEYMINCWWIVSLHKHWYALVN